MGSFTTVALYLRVGETDLGWPDNINIAAIVVAEAGSLDNEDNEQ